MTNHEPILDLQWVQLEHDEKYHKDVVAMPLGERMKHMALHMAKYTGYLAEVQGAADPDRRARILTDAFIITLASANTLNQDLGRELAEGLDADRGLRELGTELAERLGRPKHDPDGWFLRSFAQRAGALAKACESLDHLEAFPFRDALRESNRALFKIVLAEAAARGLDLGQHYRQRLRQIEGRSIFDGRLRPAIRAAAE